MGPSIDQIVSRAGVARATVYRVLADHPHVSARTRAKVLAAIHGLGYPKTRRANHRRGKFALWLPGITRALTTPHVSEMIEELEAALAGGERSLRTISKRLPERAKDLPLELLREEFEAVFTVQFYSERHLGALTGRWPVISFFTTRQVPGVLAVTPDYAGAGRLAVEHLAGLGHRRIALVTGEIGERNFARRFFNGYVGAMLLAGLELDRQLVHARDGNLGSAAKAVEEPAGVRAARDLLALSDPPSAIVARHDSLIGIVRVLDELGLRMGRDTSVVGCGSEGILESFSPSPAAVVFSCRAMVDVALELAGSVPQRGGRLTVPVEFREGESTRRL
jgi:LacI family transcriptional regulator